MLEVFREYISGPVVQSKCVNCHVQGGVSGHTRLVFVRSSDAADHEARKLRAFEEGIDTLEDEGGGNYILNKIQGVSHGGGAQVPLGCAHFVNMEWFLGLLGEPIVRVRLTPETLFDTVVLASDRKTLRRAPVSVPQHGGLCVFRVVLDSGVRLRPLGHQLNPATRHGRNAQDRANVYRPTALQRPARRGAGTANHLRTKGA